MNANPVAFSLIFKKTTSKIKNFCQIFYEINKIQEYTQ